MRKTLLLLCALPLLMAAQNLVPNPGFETQTSCPLVSEITKGPPWNSPSIGTPDLFNSTCPQQNGLARTGNGSAGIYILSTFPNSREYLQVRLTSPLVSGQNYCVEFYVKRANFKFASDRFGAYFSVDSIYMQQTNPLPFTPQVQHPLGNFIVSTSSWTKVSGSFTASGGEAFLIIGNFFDDANSTRDSVGTGSDVAYYKVDDVSVTACVTGIEEVANSSLIVYPNPASSVLTIETAVNADALQVFSLTGELVREATLSGKRHEIYTADLPNGLYTLVLHSADGPVLRKFSIAH